MKIRVYADTSVIGGCFDDEFAKPSMELVDHFKTGEKILVISDLTLREIEDSPQKVQDVFQSIPINFREYITLDNETRHLAQKYIEEEAISSNILS